MPIFFPQSSNRKEKKFEWARRFFSRFTFYFLLFLKEKCLLSTKSSPGKFAPKMFKLWPFAKLKVCKMQKFRGLTEPSRFPSENFYSFKVFKE